MIDPGYIGILELMHAGNIGDKKKTLSTYKDNAVFKKFLYYALRPDYNYGVTSKEFKKYANEKYASVFGSVFNDIFDCCDFLCKCRDVDESTMKQVVGFVLSQGDSRIRSIFQGLITNKIKLGVTERTVNKIIPDLIPETNKDE